MYVSLSLFLVVVAAVIFWLKNPVQRPTETKGFGWIREVNLLGFFFAVENMSARYNRLCHKEKELKDKLKQVVKDKEDEKKALDLRVKYLQDSWKSFLREWVGKRNWRYWYRRVTRPSFDFMPELTGDKPKAPEKTRTVFSIRDIPPSLRANMDPKTHAMVFVPKPRPPNQGKQKNGNQNNQQQNNGGHS